MASISKVRIANMALSNIGSRSAIESLTEDSAEANECNLWYDWSRIQTLEAFNWSFARRSVSLATHGDDAPTKRWAYRYVYPSNCVSIRFIENPIGEQADPVPFETELGDDGDTLTIVTDQASAVAIYTFDLETTSLFSPHFIDALAAKLAARVAFALTGDKDVVNGMQNLFSSLIVQAPAFSASQKQEKAPREAEHIRARSA